MKSRHASGISTIIPVFLDSGLPLEFLDRAIDSIIMQSKPPLEILVADDSSAKFGVRDWVDFRSKQTPIPIRYLRNPNAPSLANNSNFSLNSASGDAVHILHSDDYLISATCYESALQLFVESDCNWIFLESDPSFPLEIHNPHLIFGINSLGGPSGLIARKECYLRYNQRFKMFVDIDLYLRLENNFGPPGLLRGKMVAYGEGFWQSQKQISRVRFYRELFSLLRAHRLSFTTLLGLAESDLGLLRKLVIFQLSMLAFSCKAL
jgi:glycosyltransferase involved in cell wall biosynthesis